MTDDDRLERALRAPGPREAGYEPRALPAALDGAARSHRAAVGLLRFGLLATGALAAAALTFAVLSRLPGSGGAGGPGPSASAAPSSSSSAALPVCSPGDLAIAPDPWGGAAGSRGTTVLFRAVSSADRCVVEGKPAAEVVDAGGTVLVRSAAAASGASVELGPGAVAELNVSWSNWCGDPQAVPRYLVLDLSGSQVRLPISSLEGSAFALPPCNGAGEPSQLNVLPFEPSTRSFPGG